MTATALRAAGARLLLTDAEMFPFREEQLRLIADAGAVLVELDGHDPDDVVRAGAGCGAVFAYYLRVDDDLLRRLPNLKVVARCGVGYEKIDVEAARKRHVSVTYVPAYGTAEVAEHAVALLLACARRLGAIDRSVQAGGWPAYPELGPMYRVAGSTLGLLGFGRIAREVARKTRGLDMEVIAFDVAFDEREAARIGVEPVGFEELLERSDFLSVHVPLLPTTHHLLDATAFARMRPGVVLVNTSRGGVVEQEALVAALESGRVGGAGLDVLEREPPDPGDGLLARRDVIVSSHSAAYSEQAFAELMTTAVLDALAVLADQAPRYPVPERVDLAVRSAAETIEEEGV